jgi:hypothetical protein
MPKTKKTKTKTTPARGSNKIPGTTKAKGSTPASGMRGNKKKK